MQLSYLHRLHLQILMYHHKDRYILQRLLLQQYVIHMYLYYLQLRHTTAKHTSKFVGLGRTGGTHSTLSYLQDSFTLVVMLWMKRYLAEGLPETEIKRDHFSSMKFQPTWEYWIFAQSRYYK